MKEKTTKFLFFIERELHIPMLLNIMKYIARNKLGNIGISSVKYLESKEGVPGKGLRAEILKQNFDFDYKIIKSPYQYKPDLTFVADFSYHYVEGLGKIVNVGHGTISKGWFFSKEKISRRENCADLICVPGEIHKNILKKNVNSEIKITGLSKLDPIFNNQINKSDIIKKMELDPEQKTVVFAPTFNKELSLIPHLKKNLREYIPNYLNLIIKLHGAAPDKWKKRFYEISQNNENTYYCEDLDITESLVAGDVLLTDVSSVAYEFSALDKPVILFDSPTQREYPNYNPESIEYKYRKVGEQINDPDRIQEAIFKLLLKDHISKERKEIAQKFISLRNGNRTKQIV